MPPPSSAVGEQLRSETVLKAGPEFFPGLLPTELGEVQLLLAEMPWDTRQSHGARHVEAPRDSGQQAEEYRPEGNERICGSVFESWVPVVPKALVCLYFDYERYSTTFPQIPSPPFCFCLSSII